MCKSKYEKQYHYNDGALYHSMRHQMNFTISLVRVICCAQDISICDVYIRVLQIKHTIAAGSVWLVLLHHVDEQRGIMFA